MLSNVDVIEKDLSEVKQAVARLETKVDLLVEGKIKHNDSEAKQGSKSVGDRVAIILAETLRLAAAGLAGFFAGKGGV